MTTIELMMVERENMFLVLINKQKIAPMSIFVVVSVVVCIMNFFKFFFNLWKVFI